MNNSQDAKQNSTINGDWHEVRPDEAVDYRNHYQTNQPVAKPRRKHGMLFYSLIFVLVWALTSIPTAIFITTLVALFNYTRE